MDLGRVFTEKDSGSITVGKIKETLILGNLKLKLYIPSCAYFLRDKGGRGTFVKSRKLPLL